MLRVEPLRRPAEPHLSPATGRTGLGQFGIRGSLSSTSLSARPPRPLGGAIRKQAASKDQLLPTLALLRSQTPTTGRRLSRNHGHEKKTPARSTCYPPCPFWPRQQGSLREPQGRGVPGRDYRPDAKQRGRSLGALIWAVRRHHYAVEPAFPGPRTPPALFREWVFKSHTRSRRMCGVVSDAKTSRTKARCAGPSSNDVARIAPSPVTKSLHVSGSQRFQD